MIHLATLDDQYEHKSSNVTRTFDIDYNKINAELAKKAPNANIFVGPGTPMWVMARWMWDSRASKDPYEGSTLGIQHYEGGTGKSDGDFNAPMPTNGWSGATTVGKNRNAQATNYYQGGTAVDLDLANNVGTDITSQFPEMKGAVLGSRYERELKLHVDLAEMSRVRKELDDLVKNPKEVEKLFGRGATMVEDRRFVNSPMIDKYLDNNDFDAASRGAAVRFRTGSGVTKLNFKPDDGVYRGNGVFDRVEYEGEKIKTPKTIEKFADSNHPANFMNLLRGAGTSSSVPSDFLSPSIKITDKRRKYKLKLPTGEEVELSLDHVKARQMKGNKLVGEEVEFGQLEVEIDHMGAQGSNNFKNTGSNQQWNNQFDTLRGAKLTSFLKSLKPGAAIGGTLVGYQFHGAKDFDSKSSMHRVNKATFTNTDKVFDKIRKALFPNGHSCSGQKCAVATAALGLLEPKDWAPSVKQMVKEHSGKSVSGKAAESCLAKMVKIAKKS